MQLGIGAQVLAGAQDLPAGAVAVEVEADGAAAFEGVGLHFLRHAAHIDLRRAGAGPGAGVSGFGIHA